MLLPPQLSELTSNSCTPLLCRDRRSVGGARSDRDAKELEARFLRSLGHLQPRVIPRARLDRAKLDPQNRRAPAYRDGSRLDELEKRRRLRRRARLFAPKIVQQFYSSRFAHTPQSSIWHRLKAKQ